MAYNRKSPDRTPSENSVFEFREPPRTGFELRWTVFGITFRVLPSFFLISAVLAFFFVGFNPVAIAIDVACIFFAFLFTEFVQGIVYRSYGLRSTVLLQELGGGIYPESEPPTAIQRIVVALASPASCFFLYAIVYYSNQEYNWKTAHPGAAWAYQILWIISVFWGIIGLLPIFPYPGGRVMLEVFNFLSRRNGLIMTLLVSIAVAVAYLCYVAAVVLFKVMREIPLVENVRLPASIILSVFLVLTTVRNFQFLQMALAARRNQPVYHEYDDYDDERAPWDRRQR